MTYVAHQIMELMNKTLMVSVIFVNIKHAFKSNLNITRLSTVLKNDTPQLTPGRQMEATSYVHIVVTPYITNCVTRILKKGVDCK